MNIKHIVLGFFAAAAVLVGCQPKEEDFGVAKIEVSTGQLTFGPASGSQTLQVTASRDWTVTGLPEWIAVDPAGGAPSKSAQTVTVTVIANDGYNREADVTFSIGLMKEYVKVLQTGQKGEYDTGNGTKERPYSASAAADYVSSLPADTESSDAIYIKGIISSVGTTYEASGNYGNASFYISDDGSSTGTQFYVFQTYYLGNNKWKAGDDDVKVGDEVIVYGKVINYKGNTPETVGKGASYVYSHNGKTAGDNPNPPAGDPKGTGVKDDPYNPAAAINAVKDLTWTDNNTYDATGEVYVKGKISRIADKGTFTDGGTYGNASFYISEDGTSAGEFYCFRVLYLGNKKFESGQTDIKVGDEVIICGQLMNYKGNTPETVAGKAYLYSLNGNTGGGDTPPPAGDPKGTGVKDDPYNPAAAINAVKDLTWTDNNTYDATGEVYVKGKISKIASGGTFTEGGTYGNASFYISEDGSSAGEFYCFRVLYLGNKKFESGQTDIKVGDEVIICGQLMNYRGNTPETVAGKAYLYSLNGDTGGGDTPPTPPAGDPKGTGVKDDPYNPAAAINAVKDLTWTDNNTFDATGDVYVKGKISRIADKGTFTEGGTYGNASFYISEDGSSAGEFYCFRVLYLGNKKFESGQTDIKVGDEVIIYGQLMNYKGNTPETVSGKAFLYSLNGKTEGGDTPTPPDPAVTPTDIATIIAANDDSSVAAENVYVGAVTTKGYVATDGKKSIYVYENASPTVKIGDIVKFTGTKTTYYGLPEITSPKTTKTSSGTVTYPDPVDITANFDKYTASEAVYVKYKATMYKSGNYTNFKVAGASELNGSFSNAQSAYYDGINEGDEVVIYGYFNGINTNNKLLNVIPVKIENLTTGKTIPSEGGSQGGGGEQQGNVVTVDFTAQGYENAQDFAGITVGDIVISADKGDNKNGPKYYTSGTAIRLYGGNSMTIKSNGKNIQKVEFSFGSGEGTNEITANAGTWASPTWTGPASSVVFTIGGTSGHRRIQKLVITLAE